MTRPQFFHVDTFAREVSSLASPKKQSWTVTDIVGEAIRDAQHCRHVSNAEIPEVMSGQPLDELPLRLERLLSDARRTIKDKNGITKTKSIRRDAHVLLAAVYSFPDDKPLTDKGQRDAFFKDCIKFHASKFGEVDSAVLHIDEGYYHIHVFTISVNVRRVHPGYHVNKNGEFVRAGNRAYKKAMSKLQDEFYQSVAIHHGMDRTGPKRERLSRSLYKKAQEDSDAAHLQWEAEQKRKREQKLSERERHYFEEMRLFEESRRLMQEEINYLTTMIGSLKEAEAEIYELRYELAIKNALIGGMTTEDDDPDSPTL
ncbi:plasmid recombination protein [Methylophaga thiooxydans]|uniref:plasmid recombination protein n=1 Tax=Methylophaga thiooxydans TaxID=392484 RepID=UPI002351F8C0|nr:plasmid recombination protein [Methylophaga thiooxydans]